jgi:hypothetical protein
MTLGASISEGAAASTGKTAAETCGIAITDSVPAILPTMLATRRAGTILISVPATIAESHLNMYGASHLTTTAATFLAIPSVSIVATAAASVTATFMTLLAPVPARRLCQMLWKWS